MKKFLCLCFLVCTLLTHFSGCSNDSLVECPDFVGKDFVALSTGEQYDMFKFEAEFVDNGDLYGDVVLSQGTEVGKRIERGSIIKLQVSLGAPKVAVPDVKGKTAEEAISILESAGFIVAEVHVPNSDYDAGICYSTLPISGKEAPKGSTVSVNISLGAKKKLVKYISVTGKRYDKAVSELNKIGLNVGSVVYKESDKPSGTVIEQFPNYKNSIEIAEGSLINLTVAK